MKRNVITLFFLLAGVGLYAQTQSLGVQVGFSETVLRENTSGTPKKLNDNTVLNGAKVGLVYDATLVKGFGFTMGVNYVFGANQTKWKQDPKSSFTADKVRYQNLIHTIEVPIDWQYKFEIAQQTWLILYSGPTIQYNFSFKNTTSYKNDVLHTSSSATYNHYSANNALDKTGYKYGDRDQDGKADYSPLNIQWGVGAGFQYKNYYLRGGYNFGIYSHYKDYYYTNPDGSTEYKMRGRMDEWNIKVGIYFLNF